MRRALPLSFFVLLAACSRSYEEQPPIHVGPVASASAIQPKLAPSAAPLDYRASAAHFEGGNLVECFDSVLDVAPEGGLFSSEAVTVLARPCKASFADRAELGTCAMTVPGGTITQHVYDFGAVFHSDKTMQECITSHGAWSAVARNSPEYKRAELEAATRDIEKIRKQYPSATGN